MSGPARGDIWLGRLDPVEGHETGGLRPLLVVSVDPFNDGPADLVIALPVTSTLRGIASHVVVRPPEGGLKNPSAVQCEAVRSVSKRRLARRWGRVSPSTLAAVEDRLRILMGL